MPRPPAQCHPERPTFARGWCENCYAAWRRKHRTKKKPNTKRAPCHPERPHYAKGLCMACYLQARKYSAAADHPATCHPERRDYSAGKCWPCYSKRADQRKRDRKFLRHAAPIASTGSATPGLDADGFGRCWRCSVRRSLKAGIPRLICKRCQTDVLALYERRRQREGKTTLYLSELTDPVALMADVRRASRDP